MINYQTYTPKNRRPDQQRRNNYKLMIGSQYIKHLLHIWCLESWALLNPYIIIRNNRMSYHNHYPNSHYPM